MVTPDLSALPTNDRGERLITHLRHVDLAVPDYDRQLRFYTEMWGLSPETTNDGIAFLAAEGSPEQYSVRLRKDDNPVEVSVTVSPLRDPLGHVVAASTILRDCSTFTASSSLPCTTQIGVIA